MTMTTNRLMMLCGGVLLALFSSTTSCTEPAASECAQQNIFCPPGYRCAAAQPICLAAFENCGDGIEQADEACDDGNLRDGDGCAADCKSDERCGNNVIDATIGEICDDGNQTAGDGCSPDCLSKERCGNDTVDDGEVCDDGNINPEDACRADCHPNLCGDGIINKIGPGIEQCDGGTIPIRPTDPPRPRETELCNIDCTTAVCGDGKVNRVKGESCDTGSAADSPSCNSDCSVARCGDGKRNAAAGEGCDDGRETAACDNDCTLPVCGDNRVNIAKGEQCDPGAVDLDTSSCNANCTIARCGDLRVNQAANEQCDRGGVNASDCDANCSFPVCGDGLFNPMAGEQCDDATTATDDDCIAVAGQCRLGFCGDGFRNTAGLRQELCDDGNRNDFDGCRNDCTPPSCDDGVVQMGEQCDDANSNPNDNCVVCRFSICGDTYVDAELPSIEDCEPPNSATCSATCHTIACHNGVLDPNEECDDNDTDNTDSCVGQCQVARCGDAFIWNGVEECDDGVNRSGACTPICKVNVCGDGVRQTSGGRTEQCDDGNTAGGDGCSPQCEIEID